MAAKLKKLAVLGSTGSIGQQTLDIVRAMPERFSIVGLAAGNNYSLLTQQIQEFKPEFFYYAGYSNENANRAVFLRPRYLPLEQIAAYADVDVVVVATSGLAGLDAILAAVNAGKTIALANKESLVAAGGIITTLAKKNKAKILPIDSEHSAIWQCLNGEKQAPSRIILTASGGPFLDYPIDRMQGITITQALAHPSWKMGKKVTIDSATLMNKGLEIIEVHWLFNVPIENVSVIIHPQSIIHSMVEFIDGSVKAQLSMPDMRLPIQYALSYPERLPNTELPRLDWSNFADLTFQQPDVAKFPCLRLAIEAGKRGGTYPAVLCAADDIAVDSFLQGKIRFLDIAGIVEKTLEKHESVPSPSLDNIKAVDKWARETALKIIGGNV
jgi:1-deoxy-D-xylulose-5-phosphate reductoisomerase